MKRVDGASRQACGTLATSLVRGESVITHTGESGFAVYKAWYNKPYRRVLIAHNGISFTVKCNVLNSRFAAAGIELRFLYSISR